MTTNNLASPSAITIRPITSETDLPRCAHLADIATKPDGLHEFKTRYGSKGIYCEALERMTEALRDERPRNFLFKAVVPLKSISDSSLSGQQESQSSDEAAETIVGFTQWRLGYIETPKMDPFAPREAKKASLGFEAGPTNVVVAEASSQENAGDITMNGEANTGDEVPDLKKLKPLYSNPHAELGRRVSNVYIGTIRGTRHVCKSFKASLFFLVHLPRNVRQYIVVRSLMTTASVLADLARLIVDPSYQRQGIGQKLLNWGIETADDENIVAWLFCRPAGYKLYERNGWKVVLSVEVDVPDDDLEVAPVVAMLRSPRKTRKGVVD